MTGEAVVPVSGAAAAVVDECRFCHCNGDCRILGDECGWRDEAHTVCTNTSCVIAHEAEKLAERRKRFKSAKRADQVQILAKQGLKAAKKKSRAKGAK